MHLKVLVFAYCNGIRSSQTIDRLLERDIAFLLLSANQQPNCRTIFNFRTDNRGPFMALFAEVLELCDEAGMVDLGEVALDGRLVQDDSAVDKNRTREQIEAEIEEILAEAAKIDDNEDDENDPENRGDELPEELQDKENRLERQREAKANLDEEEQACRVEQIEKIHEQASEEQETGKTKPGRKPIPPEEVELDDDAKANVTDPESSLMKPHDG